MASLNGISFKKFKEFRGQEWPVCAQADLYEGKQPIGFWSQSAYGGCDDYEGGCRNIIVEKAKVFKTGFDEKLFPKRGEGIPTSYSFLDDPDIFMFHLMVIKDNEKMYKRISKQTGFTGTVMYANFGLDTYAYPVTGPVGSMKELQEKYPEDYRYVIKNTPDKKPTVIWCSSSMDDFNVTIDENHPAPLFMYYI